MADLIKEIVTLVAQQMECDESKIAPAQLLDQQGIDEFDLIEIIMRLEEQYGIEISDEDAEQLTTITHVAEYINQRKK